MAQESFGEADAEDPRLHLEAHAADQSTVFQAGRDQHLHFPHGVRRTRTLGDGAEDVCPYPGLATFDANQAQWFFGRDRALAALCSRVADKLKEPKALVVLGPSGVGKSSLLRAGLMPAIARGVLPAEGSASWPRFVITPTADPLTVLAEQLAGICGTDPLDLARRMSTDPPGSVEWLCRHFGNISSRVVMVVDQFEELFTLCGDERKRRTFIELLTLLATASKRFAVVIIGLRADFYATCTAYESLRAALRAGPVLLDPMSPAELRQAISHPALVEGLEVEAGLIDVLLRDLGVNEPDTDAEQTRLQGRLPLLAHALRATWQQRQGHVLTLDGYQMTGGIQHAIATSAEQLFTDLNPDAQQLAKIMFLRLVKIGESVDDVRRRRRQEELLLELPDTALARDVIQVFTGGRLLTQESDSITITHEALLYAWPRLKGWINEDRSGNLIRQDLNEAAAVWDRNRHEASSLYRGGRLAMARVWATGHPSDLTPLAQQFLKASHHHQRRAVRRGRAAISALVVLSILTSVAAVVAVQQSVGALRQRDQAVRNRVLTEALQQGELDTSLAAQLNLAAYRMSPSDEIASRLLSTQSVPLSVPVNFNGYVHSVAFHPTERLAASGHHDGTVRLWNLVVPGRPVLLGKPLTGHSKAVRAVAFRPDGAVLASGADTIRLWDVTSPGTAIPLGRPMPLPKWGARSIAFTPDGKALLIGSEDGTIAMWDVSDPSHPSRIGKPVVAHKDYVASVTVDPSGHLAATGSADGSIRLWSINGLRALRPVARVSTGSSNVVHAVAFDRTGRFLASGGHDGEIRLWSYSGGKRIAPLGEPLTGHSSYVFALAFSPDGNILASGGDDGTIRLWNLTDPLQPVVLGQPLFAHRSAVGSIAFSKDGTTLVSASADQTMRIWDIPQTALLGHTAGANTLAFSPDGRLMASGGGDGAIRLWSFADPAHPVILGRPLDARGGSINAVAFSPDGRFLASGHNDHGVRLWDVRDPSHAVPYGKPLNGHRDYVSSVAFSADGQVLASSAADGTVRLWDLTAPDAPALLGKPITGHDGGVYSVAFSPKGRLLATAGEDATMRLWDAANPARVVALTKPLTGHSNAIWQVVFSPDGRAIATAGADNSVRLWDVTDPRRPTSRALGGYTSGVWSVAFSSDGRALASGTFTGLLHLWDVADLRRPRAVGGPLTGHTAGIVWLAYRPGSRQLLTAGADSAIQMRDLNVDRSIARICSATGHVLTSQLWSKYVTGLPYRAPCDD